MSASHPAESGPSAFRMTVVGVGGGGIRCLSRFSSVPPHAPDLLAVHTDSALLEHCSAPQKLPIGQTVTGGLGTGGDVEQGMNAALSEQDKIRSLLADSGLVCIVTSLGGGTGTGAAPEIVRMAREEGALTLAFATLPFPFEGPDRQKAARKGLTRLLEQSHAVVCIPNERLGELAGMGEDTALEQAFDHLNEILVNGLMAYWRMMVRPGLVNLDFADVQQMVQHSGGGCSFAYVEADGEARAAKVAEKVVTSPLLDRGNTLAQARGVVVGLTGGPDLRIAEVQLVMDEIREMAHGETRFFFGTDINPEFEGRIGVTLFASEQWHEGASTPLDFPNMEVPAADDEKAPSGSVQPETNGKKTRIQLTQTSLNLDPPVKGRFRGVEPTLYGGEDLDIPTFIRRKIKLINPS